MRGSVVKRGKTYSIVYYIGTKQKWEAIGPNKKEAEKALAEKLADLNKAPYRELKKVSFTAFAQKWLVDYAEGKVKPGRWTIINALWPCISFPFSGRRLCNTFLLKWCRDTSHAKRPRVGCLPRPSITCSFSSRRCSIMRSDGDTCGRIRLCTSRNHASNVGKWTSSLRKRLGSCSNMPALVIACFSFAPC